MKYKIVGNEHAVGDFIPTSGRNANIQQHYDLYRLHTEIPDYRPYHPCCKALFYCYRIPHQISYRVLSCHNALIIRKDHPAALVARFPIRQKCLYIEVVLAIRVECVDVLGFKVHTDWMCRVHGFQC